MKKTSIYVDDDVDVALARRAAAEGTTKAELIRRALRDAAGGALRIKPRARGVFSVTRPLIVAEIDHLVGARRTRAALSALRSDLVAGAYLGEWSSESTGPGSALRAARIVKR